MTEKEQLWYLINGALNGSYDIKTFCTEFTRIYDLETDYTQLSDSEYIEFRDLCKMTARFSSDNEELKIPNMYYSEEEIVKKIRSIKMRFQD